MNLSHFLTTWRGTQAENKVNRVIIAALLAANIVLAIAAMRSEATVVLLPDVLQDQVEVGPSYADQGFKESWALYLAQVMGNVTPANVDFTIDRLALLLSPSVYQQVMVELRQQAAAIKRDRVSTRFEPREVIYERTTDRVFVTGFSYTTGPGGAETRQPRTFETVIRVNRYRPVFDRIETYQGRPRTQKELNRRGNRTTELAEDDS